MRDDDDPAGRVAELMMRAANRHEHETVVLKPADDIAAVPKHQIGIHTAMLRIGPQDLTAGGVGARPPCHHASHGPPPP